MQMLNGHLFQTMKRQMVDFFIKEKQEQVLLDCILGSLMTEEQTFPDQIDYGMEIFLKARK